MNWLFKRKKQFVPGACSQRCVRWTDQSVNIRQECGCCNGVFEPSRCSSMLTDGKRLWPKIAMPRMHKTGSTLLKKKTVTLWLVYQRISYWNNAFFQNIVEVTSVFLCVCLRHSSGVLFGSVDQQLHLSRSSAGKFALYFPLCANSLSLREECVSVGLRTCVIPTGPVFNAELNFIPCCFSI